MTGRTRARARVVPVVPVVLALAVLAVAGCAPRDTPPTAPDTVPAPSSTTAPATPFPSRSPSVEPSATDPSATGSPVALIASATWARVDVGGGVRRETLRVRPTAAGRTAGAEADRRRAWAEVVALRPDADTETMRDQFDCHWRFARLVDPDKPSWNLEPWRPVVDEETMIDTRCNPGGAEI